MAAHNVLDKEILRKAEESSQHAAIHRLEGGHELSHLAAGRNRLCGVNLSEILMEEHLVSDPRSLGLKRHELGRDKSGQTL